MIFPKSNKTIAALLATVTGAFGLHRFYMNGRRDGAGWLHLVCGLGGLIALLGWHDRMLPEILLTPTLVSGLVAIIESLVIGLTPDERWHARFADARRPQQQAGWPLAVILVANVAIGAFGLLFLIARGLDLWLTGASYG